MQPELPRTGLNGSALVELLAQLALARSPATPPSFVDGLGRWLGWKDAIGVSAALQAVPPQRQHPHDPAAPGCSNGAASAVSAACAASAPSAASAALAALDAEFTRVRAALGSAIAQALDEAAGELAADLREGATSPRFLPWRQRYFNLQQAMEGAVLSLRVQARAALLHAGAQHPHLSTLATLDTALAAALAPREQAQLALMPVLLEKHHRRADVAPAAFRHHAQQLLQAELELRLQPSLGLLDALRTTLTESP